MPERRPETHHSSLSLKDVLLALFKHKWKIALCAIAGLIAAAAFYFLYPPVYESDAKLLVRYVLERSAVDPIDSTNRPGSVTWKTTDSIIGSEVEILTSWDLAVQVADALGPKRLGAPSKEAAAGSIISGLQVTAPKGSDVIFISYQSREPEIATLVLSELVNRYFIKHLEVHRSAGAFDFVTQQTDQVRARLNQTEDALKVVRGKFGITSLAESITALNTELARTQAQLPEAEAELAERRAVVKQMDGSAAVAAPEGGDTANPAAPSSEPRGPAATAAQPATNTDVQKYQALVSRLAELRKIELDLHGKYTPENQLVKANQSEIADVERQRRDLEKKFPDLPDRIRATASRNQQGDSLSETARLAGSAAKTEALKSHLRDLQERIRQLSDASPQIADLERQKELTETNYKYFEATLEKARVDEALDPSKMPNISAVQKPSPPVRVTKTQNKIALGLAAGGAALGIAFALLSELVFKQTLKRPLDLERRLGTLPLLSIPDRSPKALARPFKRRGKKLEVVVQNSEHANLAPWEEGHFIRPYSEAMRDRVTLYFERNRMTHRPKFLGVTAFSKGAGTSTIAAGLAAALSEMRDGKVLLVDVNVGHAEAHPFFEGRPATALSAVLKPGGSSPTAAADNLYLATVAQSNDGPVQRALKRFFSMMPNLKASDFDYIIFDMPPLTPTSSTLGMAEYMDKVLLVVEAEKNNRDVVRRGYAELAAGRANVSVVMNKVRSYLPKWVDGDS